ncbi:ATP-dependent Clp protease ATP-binding subunit ClpX [Trichinella pseudospiralis]
MSGRVVTMANTSFNISDLVNQNGETVPLHSEHDKLIDYTIMCLAVLAVIVNSSLLFSMCKNNTIKNRIFIAAYAIGTGTTGLAFVIGYYYRIINHDVRFHTTSLRICMTKTPHISLYVVGDTLMAISILCMSVERLLSVHLAMHFRHLNSKIHLLLIVTTFLWPTIQLLAVWFSIADPEHWNSKVPAVCFLRTTVPKRTKPDVRKLFIATLAGYGCARDPLSS